MADDDWAPWAAPSRGAPSLPKDTTTASSSAQRGAVLVASTSGGRTAPPKRTTAGGEPTAGGQSAAMTSSPRSRDDSSPADRDRAAEREAPGRGGRPPLSRPAIVDAALRVVDEEGLDALNMRRLGMELGVGAMAVYRHIKDKDELLDLIIEGVLGDVERPVLTGDWREDAAAIARSTREGLMRHRHAVALLASRPWVGPTGLDGIDTTLGVFRTSGLDARGAVYAQFALGNFVTGFCAWESANLGAASDDPQTRAAALARYQAFVAALPHERFPNLVDLASNIVAGSLDERFEFGLRALLDGLEAGSRRTSGDRGRAE